MEGSLYQITLSFIAKIKYLFPEKSNAIDLIHPAETFNDIPCRKALFQVEQISISMELYSLITPKGLEKERIPPKVDKITVFGPINKQINKSISDISEEYVKTCCQSGRQFGLEEHNDIQDKNRRKGLQKKCN